MVVRVVEPERAQHASRVAHRGGAVLVLQVERIRDPLNINSGVIVPAF
jgi:hypothetical protein